MLPELRRLMIMDQRRSIIMRTFLFSLIALAGAPLAAGLAVAGTRRVL